MSGSTEIARQKSERPKKATSTQSVQLLPLMIKSATSAGLLLAVWGVGWMKFGVSWVIGASALYFVGKEFRKSNKAREEEAKAAEEPTLARVDELPSWVYFPDIERAEWLNKVVQQMWPYIGEHVAKTLRDFQDRINEKVPKYLQPFRFEDICLGDIPPRLGGVKVYIDNVKRDEIVLDAELSYLGDADINVSLNGIKAGIKDILLHGTVRIILRPLINKIPLVGGFEFCFLAPPNMDFDFTNFANALDMPILSDSLRKVITDQVSNIIVLPNFMRVDLCSDVDMMMMNKKEIQMPQAVIKVNLMEADDLKRADVGKIFGKGKSDPYCKITVGGVTYSTKVIQSTVKPRWNESFEFIVKDIQGQEIEVNVYDHDDHVNDDFIGNTYIRMEDLAKVGHMDEWIKLSNVKTGRIHVVADIYYLTADAKDPNKLKNTTSSTAILFVSVDSAKDLASHSKGLVEPSPYVTLQLGHTILKTSPKPKTTNPRWDESFNLMVTQPENEALTVQVLDSNKNDELLGKVFFRLNKILEDEDMTLNRPFALESTTCNCTVTMRLCLRFLTTSKPEVPEQQAIQHGLESSPGSKTEGGSVSEIPSASKNEAATKPRYRGRQATVDSKHGRIQLTLRYNQEKEKLIVTVHKCENLVAYDKDQFSDPYVRMYLLPDRSEKAKKKTEVIKNNLNPVWEESYEWPVRKVDLPLKTLEVMVKNFIGVFEKKTRTEMGVLHLRLVDFDNLSQPVSDWFDLQDPESFLSETTSFFSA